jgi:pilin isopeptide linkage protein
MKYRKILKRAGSLAVVFLLLAGIFTSQVFAEDAAEGVPKVISDEDGISVTFQVSLEIEGDEPKEDHSFTFVIEPDGGNYPLPSSNEATITGEDIKAIKSIDDTDDTEEIRGTASFGAITFKEAGTYVYRIWQKDGGHEHYEYDDSVYKMQVKVSGDGSSYTTNGSNLQVSISGSQEGENEKISHVLFRNTYTEPEPTPTEEAEPTPSEEPDPTPSEEAEPTPSEEPDPTPSEDPDPTPSEDPNPTPSEEAEPTPSEEAEPTPSVEITPAADAGLTPTAEVSPTVEPSQSATPTPTDSSSGTTNSTSSTSATTASTTTNASSTTSPKTGDETNIALWTVLLGVTVAGMAICMWCLKRTRKHSRH